MRRTGCSAACIRPGRSCPASWRREWTADSSIALCVEPAFVRKDVHTWQRPEGKEGAAPRDLFSVELVTWPDDSASLQHWPPQLASGPDCRADCITADSATSHTDRLAGLEARTEVGLISGGVAGLQRSAATPDIPTPSESGLPDFEVIAWWGLLAPAKTPRAVVNALNREMRAVLEVPEVKRSLVDQGMDPAAGSPEQFGALIKTDMEKWGAIGARLGVKLD